MQNIITWNMTNWITVVVMVAVGFMILGALGISVRKMRDRNAEAA